MIVLHRAPASFTFLPTTLTPSSGGSWRYLQSVLSLSSLKCISYFGNRAPAWALLNILSLACQCQITVITRWCVAVLVPVPAPRDAADILSNAKMTTVVAAPISTSTWPYRLSLELRRCQSPRNVACHSLFLSFFALSKMLHDSTDLTTFRTPFFETWKLWLYIKLGRHWNNQLVMLAIEFWLWLSVEWMWMFRGTRYTTIITYRDSRIRAVVLTVDTPAVVRSAIQPLHQCPAGSF